MSLTPEDVRRLAHLSRLRLAEAEVPEVEAKLDAILAMVDALQAIPTDGVEPMAHAHDQHAALRDDAVTETDRHALYQRGAPAVEDGLYLVPRVVE